MKFLTVLSLLTFYSVMRPGRTAGRNFTLYGSNDARRDLGGVRTMDDVILENMPPGSPKSGLDYFHNPATLRSQPRIEVEKLLI